jgi:hypothetical protein
MALAFVRSASKVSQMTDVEFFAHYGETSRVVSFFHEPANTVAGRIIELHRRHAKAVCDVFDNTIRTNAAKMRDASLPANCLLSLVVGRGGGASSYPVLSAVPALLSAPTIEIRISIDEVGKRIVFERWGEIKGVSAELIIALAASFREATRVELAPGRYPFLKTSKLIRQLKFGSDEVLRRRVLRCRNAIKKLAKDAGDIEPSMDAVIENSQWHGYRLNPDRLRLIAISQFVGMTVS